MPVRTGLQHHGRFIYLCRLRCCGRLYRPSLAAWSTSTHRAAPVCMSCLLSIKQVTAWVARFLSNWRQIIINRRLHWMDQCVGTQVAATTVWLTSNSQLEGTILRVADTVHTGSLITRRSHLNLLWIHIALSTPMIYAICYGQIWRISSQLLESS